MNDTSSFETWRAFTEFEKDVRKNRRFVRTKKTEAFLDTIRHTMKMRRARVSAGRGFWRAQLGFDLRKVDEIGEKVPSAFQPERMKPLTDRAAEGRANPAGIPMLYLCSNKKAAMCEVRPWLGSMISLGRFVTKRDLSFVDCSRNEFSTSSFLMKDPDISQWDSIVWSDISRAFTEPVTRSDDKANYIATQVLVELFRDEGFDGIMYRSAFGKSSKNLAIFNLDNAKIISCQLHEVSTVKMNFLERDNPYWVKRKNDGNKSK